MSRESAPVPANQFRISILEFIQKTMAFEQKMANWRNDIFDKPDINQRLEHERLLSKKVVNECLAAAGGIPAQLHAPDGSPRSISLREWYGTDPDEPAKHLWLVQPNDQPQQTACVSFHPAELHQEAVQILQAHD